MIRSLLCAVSCGAFFLSCEQAFSNPSPVAAASGFRIVSDAKALTDLRVIPQDHPEMASAAEALKDILEKIAGAPVLLEGGGSWSGKGILVSLVDHLPDSEKEVAAALKGASPQTYAIHISPERAVIAGCSPKAVSDAVYDLLGQLGCRWLLPSERWTVIPSNPSVSLPVQKTVSQPDFPFRSIWYAYGFGGDSESKRLAAAYHQWTDANRLGGVAAYKAGHTYGSTVIRHKQAFIDHPEYFGMDEEGNRRPFKEHQSLCYSNPDVAAFFVEDKLAELRADKAKNPYSYTVSMDPNDGSQECWCDPCKALGNGSDQALHLANIVARALRAEFPDAVVALYAYASHRLPPEKIEVEPNIEVQLAMGFNKTIYTLEELAKLWREKVRAVGIRDYFGVMAWDWGLPGRGKASNFSYVRDQIPRWHQWGARAFNTETNANWGTFGPATYVATRLLWDVKADATAVHDDYMTVAFGKAAGEMKELYRMFSRTDDLSRQNLHVWLSQLDCAFRAAEGESEAVLGRLTDIAAYLHYAVLFRNWELVRKAGDQEKAYAAAQPMLEFTWQIRDRNMVHAYALQRRLVNAGDDALKPLREGWRFNDPAAVWKKDGLLDDAAVLALFRQDLAAYPADDRIVTFSSKLVPAERNEETEEKFAGHLRGQSTWHFMAETEEHLKFDLPMVGVKFDYSLEVYDEQNSLVWESSATVSATESRYATKPFQFAIELPEPGLYRMVIKGGEDYAPRAFPEGMKIVLEIGPDSQTALRMFGPAYFLVPAGTKEILAVTNGRVSVREPGGPARTDYGMKDYDSKRECLAIPVGSGEGHVWTLTNATSGNVQFLNIPPYLATHPNRLLVPKEVR
jgi:hypothetical protein